MRPKERRETGHPDLFRARLDQIVDLNHPLVKLSGAIDWSFLEERCGAVYTDEPGRPPLPTRLMAGLAILKHMHDRSDEVLCERWIETPCWQLFCGEQFFQHTPPFDRSSLTRWRQRMGEERLIALIQESLAVATRTGAAKPADFQQVIVDTTVQEKAITFPTDAKLMHRARERLVRLCTAPASAWCAWPRSTASCCASPPCGWAKRRKSASFFAPNRAISTKVSAPASTASSANKSTSSSGYTTLPRWRGSGKSSK